MLEGQYTKEELEAKEALEKLRNDQEYLTTGKIGGKSSEELHQEYLEYKNSLIKEQRKKSFIYSSIFGIIIIIILLNIGVEIYHEYFREVKIDNTINLKSIHYTNNIYTASGFFYEKDLDPSERKEYLRWVKSIVNFEKSIDVDISNFKTKSLNQIQDSYMKLYNVIKMEHPELFYLKSFSFSEVTNINELKVLNNYYDHLKIIKDLKDQKVERKIEEIIRPMKDLSDLSKIKAIYDYLSYKHITLDSNDSNLYLGLMNKNTTCDSLAITAQVLLRRLGIDSYLITNGTYLDENRQFNIINLSDGYYYFDSCIGSKIKDENIQEDYQSGMLLNNTYDYTTGIWNIDENRLGHIFKYKKVTLQ